MCDSDYIKADSSNMSEVDVIMIMDYFNSNRDFVSGEMRGVEMRQFGQITLRLLCFKLNNMTQTYSTDWDADDYKDETEPEEHWELRKAFMEAHKGRFSEDYLVALARTFTNMEFMGCSYPAPVMIRIAELSKDIAKDYRESKKTKLQRTFVSASNAAENKIKKRQSDPASYMSNRRTT